MLTDAWRDERSYTPTEVGRMVGRHRSHVGKLIDAGAIRGETRPARGLRFDGATVDRRVRRGDLLAYLDGLDAGHRRAALAVLARLDARRDREGRVEPC